MQCFYMFFSSSFRKRVCLPRVSAYHSLISVIPYEVAQAYNDSSHRETLTAPVIRIARFFQQLQKVFDWL